MRFTILLLTFVLGLACVSTLLDAAEKPPAWVGKLHSDRYPEALYFQGVGMAEKTGNEGKDWRAAEEDARSRLVAQIQTRVQGIITITRQEEWNGKKAQIKQVVEETIQSSVDLTMGGIVVKDRFYDRKKKRYYALVVLDRQKAAARLKTRLDDANRSITTSLERGESAQDRGDVFSALQSFFQATRRWNRSETMREVYQVLKTGGDALFEELEPQGESLTLSSITTLVEELLGSLRLEVLSGDGQTITPGGSPDPLKVQITLLQAGQPAPAVNVPVQFAFQTGQGSLTGRVVTDDKGQAVCPVYRAIPGSDGLCTIRATLDGSTLSQETPGPLIRNWLQRLEGMETTFTLVQPELNLDQVIAGLVSGLTTQFPDRLRVVIGDFTYQDTPLIGPFATYLTGQLRTEITRSGKWEVVERGTFTARGHVDPTQEQALAQVSGAGAVLRGRYWEQGEQLKVDAWLRASDGGILASADQRIPRKLVVYPLKPDNADQALQAIEDFSASTVARPRKGQLQLWTDRGNGGVYYDGDEMRVYVKALKDCYIKLIYHDVKGETYQLFPNLYSGEGFVRAGQVHVIPDPQDNFRFVVQPPFGTELLKVYASSRPFPPVESDPMGSYIRYRGSPRDITRGMGVVGDEAGCVITTMPR